MKIKLYTPEYKEMWDDFVRKSKNSTFLFYRDFIEYHEDKFNDYSLLFYVGDNLIAMMAGNISDKVYYSHQGLTYGGLIMSQDTTAVNILDLFEVLTVTFRHQGIKKIVYKAVPHIYHRLPAEEDLYALFRYGGIISERNISSTIFLSEKTDYSDSRKNGLKKAAKNDLRVTRSNDLNSFWQILTSNLRERYGKDPVHNLSEITYLKDKFQNQIHLFSVTDSNDIMLGGCLVFVMENVVHAQYTAATEDGKRKGAIDMVIDYIINTAYADKQYFDYGTSTENKGQYLNESLIYQKEGFGGRGIVYDTYTINL